MAGGKEKPVKPLGWVWFIGLMLGILACLPAMLEALCAKTYQTHRHGVAVVTCASSPLGKAAVEALIEDGYVVYGGVKSEADAGLLKALGGKREGVLKPLVLDVAKPESLQAAAAKVKAELDGKPFTVLVNTVESAASAPLETQELAALRGTFETNTFGPLAVTQAFLPFIRETGARIVFMSSLCAQLTPPLFGGLCASKAALESLADALRRELTPYAISVSAIEPAVATPVDEASAAAAKDKAGEVYAHLFAGDKAQSLLSPATGPGAAAATAATMRALIHSVSSPHPKVRYPAGSIGHLPAKLVAALSWLLPLRLQDSLLA